MGADTVAFDSARANLVATGPAYGWRLDGGAEAHGLTFGGNLADQVTVKGAVTLDSTRVRAVAGELLVKDAGYKALTLRELRAVGRYDSTIALDLGLNIGDSVRVGSRIRGTISSARDTVRAQLERLTLDEGGRAWTLERPASFVLGPRVEVNQLALRAGGRSILLNGVFDRRDSSDMQLRVTGLELETLRATGLVPIGGRLDGALRLTGRAEAPRLKGKVGLTIVAKGGRQLGTLVSDLDWNSRTLHIATAARPARGGALTIDGTLPYRLTLAPRDTTNTAEAERSEADTVSLAVKRGPVRPGAVRAAAAARCRHRAPRAAPGRRAGRRLDARAGRDRLGEPHARRAHAPRHQRHLSARRDDRAAGGRRAPDRAAAAVHGR